MVGVFLVVTIQALVMVFIQFIFVIVLVVVVRKKNSSMICWYVKGISFTCTVCTDYDTGIIVEAAPILRKFIGQPLSKLRAWSKVEDIIPLEAING